MKHRPSRRMFLRGAGGIAVGLPLLEGAWSGRALAAAPAKRYITLFFGNGLPPEFTANGLTGPLEPLAPHANKLTLLREFDPLSAMASRAGGGNEHLYGAGTFAVGVPVTTTAGSSARSLDVAAHAELAPGTPLATLETGIYARDDKPLLHLRSWRGPQQPNVPIRKPSDLFARIFGAPPPAGSAKPDPKLGLYQRSVLDAVLAEYRTANSDASGLSVAARARIADHLETVRALERRIQALPSAGEAVRCAAPGRPTDPQLVPSNFGQLWDINTELFTLALRCDLVRFGSVVCTSAGDGFNIPELPGNPHNLGHGYNGKVTHGYGTAVKWVMTKLASFLGRLDDRAFADPNGGTVLDNTIVLIGSELSGPNGHKLPRASFLLAGGGGRFRAGTHEIPGRSDVDIYSTIAHQLGMKTPFGSAKHFKGLLDIVK